MSQTKLPLIIEDLSAFAKALRADWPDAPPKQTEALHWVARAAGYRNHQALKAAAPAPAEVTPQEARRLRDTLRVFDDEGRMTRWPQKHMDQGLALSSFWALLPARQDLSEGEVNAVLQAYETFGDHVLLRRSLIDHGMVKRTRDGAVYRRIERAPTHLQRDLIRTVSERRLAVTLKA